MTAGGPGPAGPPRQAADAGGGPVLAAGEVALLNELALRFFVRRLPGSWVPGYLTGRGFGPAVQRRWGAGYAPAGWDRLTRRLRSAGVPDAVIEAAGLARRTRRGTLADVFRDRAVLPIRLPDGRIAGFIGRAPTNAPPGTPTYVNSPRTCLYDKSAVLFGLCEARAELARGARPVIAEGPFDAIAVTTASTGRFAGVAPCGTALTAGQVAALGAATDLAGVGVVAAFDPDPAGRRAAVRAYHLLSPHTSKTAAAVLPAGQDPAQLLAQGGPAALAAALTQTQPLADPVVDAELDRWSRWLGHAEGRLNALHAVAPIVAAMPVDHVARQVARLAEQLSMDHAAVTEALTDAIPAVLARSPRSASAVARRDLPGPAASPSPEGVDMRQPAAPSPSRPGHTQASRGPRRSLEARGEI